MIDYLVYLTFAFSLLTAIVTTLLLLGFGRRAAASVADTPPDSGLANTVRTEADRIRSDSSEQTRGLRLEIGDSIRGFQDFFANRLDAGVEGLRSPVAALGQKLDAEISRMGQEASANRDALKLSIETKLEASSSQLANSSRELRGELITNFQRTSEIISSTLQSLATQQHERLDKVAHELALMSDRQTGAHENLRQTVEARLDAIRSENALKLDEMRQTVDEKLQTTLETRLGDSFRLVSEQLDRVHQGLGEMQSLAVGVGDLKRVLSNVKTRGTLAEGQLGTLLEQFLSPDQFVRNAQIKEHSAERVEFAIKFPDRGNDGPLLLPIDAKFPNDDYERLVQAADRGDADAVEAAALALEVRIKSFAKSISEKYINPPATTDFVVLFLPTEGLFAEILRRPGLHELLQRNYRVIITGPTTICSMLSAFQMGFRSIAIQERSSEVWKILGAVRAEFADHGKVVAKLQKQLGTATKTIDELGTRTRAMNRKLKDVETLPVDHAQTVLGLTSAVLAAAEDDEVEDD